MFVSCESSIGVGAQLKEQLKMKDKKKKKTH
jgi:hypothetical protein